MKPKTLLFTVALLTLCIYATSLGLKHTLESSHMNVNAPPATPVKLCNFNKLVLVPGSKDHTFSVNSIPAANASYTTANFNVTWKEVTPKKHAFFNWVGNQAQFEGALKKMNCVKASKQDFGNVCKITDNELNETYDNAFGKETIYKCTIPQNNFILSIRFVLQLSNFTTSPAGRWSVFTGLYQFNSEAASQKIIESQVRNFAKQIRDTSLNTFDINSNLNIIPEFVKGTLAWVFKSNLNSTYVKTIIKNKPQEISDIGFAKVLRPGTELIIGNIYNGTAAVKQICETAPFDATADCAAKL